MNSTGKYPPCFRMSKNKGVFSRKCSIPQNFPPAAGFMTGFEAFHIVFSTCSSPQAENFAKLSSLNRISTGKSLFSNWKSANFRLRRRLSELISDVEKQGGVFSRRGGIFPLNSCDMVGSWFLSLGLRRRFRVGLLILAKCRIGSEV